MTSHANYAGELSSQLDAFRKRGQSEASKHRPASDANRLDENESELLAQAERWITTEQQLFDSTLTETARAINETHQRSIELRTKIDQKLNDGPQLGDIETELAAEREGLIKASESRLMAETDWRYFRATNNIHQQAVYPESAVWHFGVVSVLALAETIMNAFFYENASGLAGGFTVALGVAVVNMAIALFLGIGFRFKNLAPLPEKVFGWSCLVAFIAAALFCNMLFAAFRSEYQALADTNDFNQLRHAFTVSLQAAVRIFYLDPRFGDLWSFILFGVGLILSGVAFWKGYTSKDKHPGYEELDRRLTNAQAAESAAQSRLREKLREQLSRSQSAIQSIIQQPTALIGELGLRKANVNHSRQSLTTQAAAVRRDFKLVIEAYRHANAAIRATPPPPYFAQTPEIAGQIDTAGVEPLLAQISSLHKEIHDLREEFKDCLNRKLEQVKGEATDILNNTLTIFLRNVFTEAEERITRRTRTIGRSTDQEVAS